MRADVVTVVGVGADGWAGLGERARAAVRAADVVVGSERQHALVEGRHEGRTVPFPKPLREGIRELVAVHHGRRLVVLASGDPMFYGIGTTLVEELGNDAVEIISGVSSMSLACARLGWPLDRTQVVSIVGRPVHVLEPALRNGGQVLVLVPDRHGPAVVAQALRDFGYGQSHLTVLTDLGGPDERRASGPAMWWADDAASDLAVVAVDCRGTGRQVVPGLPDEEYESDGQMTKRHVRAVSLAALAPRGGELLWDVGGGTGTIAVEWCRAHPANRAVVYERSIERRARIERNAERLAPGRVTVLGAAPDAFAGAPAPDAVFVGGGITAPGLMEALLRAIPVGCRLVANTVTLESEALLLDRYRHLGGSVIRLDVSRAEPIGGFTGWNPARPVTQWVWTKEGPL